MSVVFATNLDGQIESDTRIGDWQPLEQALKGLEDAIMLAAGAELEEQRFISTLGGSKDEIEEHLTMSRQRQTRIAYEQLVETRRLTLKGIIGEYVAEARLTALCSR